MKKRGIVVYYSFEGHTERIAKAISSVLEADVLPLHLVKEPKSKGFTKFIWGGRQVFMNTKPQLQPYSVDLSQYDYIVFGSPVWAGTYAPAFKTFLMQQKIKGKELVFFCSCDGGAGKIFSKFETALPENQVLGSLAFIGTGLMSNQAIEMKVREWMSTLKLV